ncbi:MAG TPA: PadR family transcriptional regulator [Candidatus Elarobacter sp.]|jgi:DNA-binding PadR family transcriptional regulator|nr:PadR family transcriptional regulator [Candidatus Elarobacter sp.]
MRDPSTLLPLMPSAFHILLALAEGESHGYAIAREVEQSTGGAMRLGTGTLYRQLKQMATDGWIADTRSDDDDALGRRYYRLTPWGRRIAQAEAERLESLVRLARARKLLPARA